jgi:zinc-ribbon domain
VKVCPHCAEELPDEATVCPKCHKDPAVPPAWAVARGRDEAPSWWPEDAGEPNPDQDLRERIERLEDATRKRPVPRLVWYSLALAFSGYIRVLFVFLPGTNGMVAFTILVIICYLAGLVLGTVARSQIEASNGRLGGLVWANIAIALNALRLFFMVFSFAQVLPAVLH